MATKKQEEFNLKARDDRFFRAAYTVLEKYQIRRRPKPEDGFVVFDICGGTDHVCVFDYIREHRLNPCVFVGLTDLYSGFPPRRPPYPVLWLTPEHHGDAPWGKVIELPKEARASGN